MIKKDLLRSFDDVQKGKAFVGAAFGDEEKIQADQAVNLTFHGARAEFKHYRSTIIRNPGAAKLYELSLKEIPHPLYHSQSRISSTGALCARSGKCTGRIPKDKRVVRDEVHGDKVWWGPVNFEMTERDFKITRKRAIDFLNTRPQLYVVDGFANWDKENQIKVRVICSTAYHALFMENMLIRPTQEELMTFGKPDFFIYNSGEFTQGKIIMGEDSNGCIALNLKEMEMVILGTCYAGEMKKGVFSLMNYIMPERGMLSMHASANLDMQGQNATVFFGLSGTGKTTLSADAHRKLIGDDEIVWGPNGISNIEGGCYAKAVNLSQKNEPEIWNAIRFGCVLENVGFKDELKNVVDYSDTSITENTRACYPLENLGENVQIPCVGGHPKNIIFLACDAFGVLPPVSKLTEPQAMFHFLSGYTAKVAGTEVGVKEPKETFSACFGEAFLVHHPSMYCELLKQKVQEHQANVWLLNTGWIRGGYGVGDRISIKHTRAIIDAIHDGTLQKAEFDTLPIFKLQYPKALPGSGIPEEVLTPFLSWESKDKYMAQLENLAEKFLVNFENYKSGCGPEITTGAPQLSNFNAATGKRMYSSSPMGIPRFMGAAYTATPFMTRRPRVNLFGARRFTTTPVQRVGGFMRTFARKLLK